MRVVILSLLLLSVPASAIQSRSITIAQDTDTDTRCFAAYLKQPIPDFEIDEEDAISFDLKNYYAAGDDNVTNSPKCTDVAPTIVAGGNAVTGLALNTTDLDNATYGGTTTTSSAGTGTLTLTFDNSIGSSVVDSIGWVVNDSGTPAVDPPMPASAYCVSNVGNDSASGHFPNCWRTTNKVNGFTFSAGNDVYFRQGDTWADSTLTIDWGGTSSDRVVIGTYYVSGGQAFVLQPDDPTDFATDLVYSNGTRAVIDGTYEASCGAGCAHDTAGAVPGGAYTALVTVQASYVTVQDLDVRDSAGIGIRVQNIDFSSPGHQYNIIQRNRVARAFEIWIWVQNAQRFIVSRNELYDGGLRRAAIPGGSNPTGIHYRGKGNQEQNYPAHGLIEANFAAKHRGEPINYNGEYIIVSGNRVANYGVRPCIYGHSARTVIQDNICLGGNQDGSAGLQTGNAVVVAEEDFSRPHTPVTDMVIRGNMCANTNVCVTIGGGPLTIETDNLQFSGYIYNNTAIESASPLYFDRLDGDNLAADALKIKNNIFYGNDATPCDTDGALSGGVDFADNVWNVSPGSNCAGTGDVIGDPLLVGSGWTTKTWETNMPTPADFALQAGSPALAIGADLSAEIADLSNYEMSGSVTYPCAWNTGGSAIDAVCANRHAATPDAGAQERP